MNDITEKSLEQQIIEEEDVDELQDLINLFNLNLKKKDIIRSAKLSEIQDNVVNQMLERVEFNSEEFSNSDLINYLKIIQDTLNKTDNSLDTIDVPTIQINQQVNINNSENDSFDREARQRILDVVGTILSGEISEEDIVDDKIEKE